MVLIHGFGGDRLTWSALVTPLSQVRRVIAVDLPGHGAAVDWPQTPDASVCADAVIATLDAMEVPQASLIGHSLGGAVAAIVGLKRPDLVERLVLLAPGGFGPEMNVRLLRRYAHARDEATMAMVLEQFFSPGRAVPDALPRLAAEQRREAALSASLARIVELLAKGDGQGTLPLSALAEAPFATSLLWGTDDMVLPVRQALEAPAAMARHILPGVGHMVHMEAPDLTLEIIVKTLTGHVTRAA